MTRAGQDKGLLRCLEAAKDREAGQGQSEGRVPEKVQVQRYRICRGGPVLPERPGKEAGTILESLANQARL